MILKMYLKSLELQGFKSFPDKIKLEFNKGLTAVVGPNGSGKSNIGDAVRWVLGEQSSKTLRGSKMEDIIFSGTQFRKSVGFAEVTLNIDNRQKLLGVDAEDVSVTRKLYRSGESEYLINGSHVRLKDICELFMDTGLGKDGYSIIGQGRIAEIVSAKSNERREIFEEAAGISKFRYKKAEAERRLALADENILRLKDIINELELRVEPLRIQSEKAGKFIAYSEKKKELEISVWIAKLETLKMQLTDLEEKLLVNSTEYENLDSDILRLEEKIQEAYKSMQNSTIKVQQFQAKILETERSNSQIHSDVAVLQNDISHANDTIINIKVQLETTHLSDDSAHEKIENESLKLKDLNSYQENLHIELLRTEEELNNLLTEDASFNKNYEDSNTTLNQLYIKQSELKFSIEAAENSRNDFSEQLSRGKSGEITLRDNLCQLAKENKDISNGLTQIEEKISLHNNKILGYQKLLETKQLRLSSAKKEYDSAIMLIKEKQQRSGLLTDLENSMEGFSNSVKVITKAGKNGRISGIKSTVAGAITVETKYSVAIETALGGSLQNIIVENEETAKRSIKLLKDENAGRATFLPITSIKGNLLNEPSLPSNQGFISVGVNLVKFPPQFSGIMASLLGRIVIAEDINSATEIAKKYGYKFKIVTLDGQVINAGGSFTGGSTSRSSGVLTRKNEIDSLNSEVISLNLGLEKYKTQVLKLQAEFDKLGFDIDGERSEITVISEDKVRFIAEQRHNTLMTEQINSQIENVISQILTLQERLTSLELKKATAAKDLDLCEKEIIFKEQGLTEAEGLKNSLQQRRMELSSTLSNLKIKEMEISKDILALSQNIQQLKDNRLEISKNTFLFNKQINDLTNIISQKQKEIEQRKLLLENASSGVDSFNESIKNEQQLHREFEQKTTEYRGDLKSKNDVKEHYSREITRLSERKLSVQKDYDSVISEMWEQYQMTRSDALEIAKPIEDMLIAVKDLNELKSKIRSLGTVNVAAIEEYKEVSIRYNFMAEQLDDVLISKRELEKLISELTDNMRKQFSMKFDLINDNFKSIFVELFEGGKAELILSNPDDVLESGIEINVAPPGKVIKNLSLLSGGEQAFVAIAIYFAILKIKPAPFCILDEIEAALDDVNVSKYARYLRNFTSTTQFILVTHRRGTMEEADTLYGVTMQEKGISKLLRMDQNDIHTMETNT